MSRKYIFSNWPLIAKLLTGMLMMSLVPLLISTYRGTDLSINALRENELRNIKQVSGNIAGRIAQLLTDSRRFAAYIAGEDSLIKLVENATPSRKEKATAAMQHLIGSNPDIDLVIVMNRNGDALMSTEPSVIGKNFKFREYFLSAIQGRPFTTSIIVGSTLGGSGVYIANPVKSRAGLVSGIVVLRITETSIRAIVEDVRYSKTRHGFIVDSDGVVVYHPDKEWLHHSLMPLTKEIQKRISQDRRFAKESIDSLNLPELNEAATGAREPGALSFPDRQNRPHIAGYAPVRVHPWTVVISAPEAEFVAPIEAFFFRNVTTVAALAIFFTGLITVFARWLTLPIKELTRSAGALASGKFTEARFDISRQDELGILARTFNQMSASLEMREHEREIFGRLVSPDVRDKLVNGELKLGGEQLLVTVLFTDIRGFTSISEATGPHEVVLMLNEYLTEMTEAIKPWNGYINNFIGDAIVVVFGAPTNTDDMQLRAVKAAFDMRKRLVLLNQRRIARGDPPIDNGIGIASGKVIAGQMGSPERCIYTVIGDTVNIAARIESMTREFEDHAILINEDLYEAVKDQEDIKGLYLGERAVKGRKASVKVYAVEPNS